ncbi:hypothetical protein [Lentilactobacillus sp. Marseille-Q4993]|uniref:hypothetical protein n=1 Tax=Lentilactobacillus sp. Marseille-Q4993 TaxID=3039492 RepID=UPI0024BCB349|nr:hypothetical protein [Lentilactobacillus sp. Marseille-Q4993]
MKLKVLLLTLLLFVGIGVTGCGSKSSDGGDQAGLKDEKITVSKTVTNDVEPNTEQLSYSRSTNKVKYKTVKFKATLDDDYDDSKLYKYVPGTKKNKTYSWKKVKAREGKRIYVDKKAVVYERDDDDDDYDTEEYYRIRFSSSSKATKYWVEEDVVEDDD